MKINSKQSKSKFILKNRKEAFKLASFNLDDNKMNSIKILLKNSHYVYIGESFKDLIAADAIILFRSPKILTNTKFIYCLLNNAKFVNITIIENYFKKNNNNQNIPRSFHLSKYIMKINLKNFDFNTKTAHAPLLFKYKISISASLYSNTSNDKYKKQTLINLINLLGGIYVEQIRMSDICLINKICKNDHIPGDVIAVREEFLYDCLNLNSLPDFKDFKYLPSNSKKIRNK